MAEPDTYTFPQFEAAATLVVAPGTTPHSRAAEIVEHARAEARALAEQAEAEGRERGYADGLARADETLAEARTALAAAAAALDAERDAVAARVEPRAVELALQLAERIVGAAVAADPELVAGVARGALRLLARRDRAVVAVAPADVAAVAAALEGVEVVADEEIARGGCVVRSEEAEVDARVGEQLAHAEEVLRAALAG